MKPGPLAGSTPGPGLITMVVHRGYEVVMAEGALEWDKEKIIEKKNRGKDDFFVNFAHNFLGAQVMESTFIYRGWKMDILSLCQILAFDSTPKDP